MNDCGDTRCEPCLIREYQVGRISFELPVDQHDEIYHIFEQLFAIRKRWA